MTTIERRMVALEARHPEDGITLIVREIMRRSVLSAPALSFLSTIPFLRPKLHHSGVRGYRAGSCPEYARYASRRTSASRPFDPASKLKLA